MTIISQRGFKNQSSQFVWGNGYLNCWRLLRCWRLLLGSAIGIEKTYENFNKTTAGSFSNLLKKMGQVEKISPQSAYACLTRSVQQELDFVSRTTPNSWNFFTEVEANIQTHVILSSSVTPVSQSAQLFYSLPTREGALNIKEKIDYETEYAASLIACAPADNEDLALLISPKNS